MTSDHQRLQPGIGAISRRSLVRAAVATKWLIMGAGTGLLAALTVLTLIAVAVLCVFGVGLPFVAPVLSFARWVADLERRRLGALGRQPQTVYQPIPQAWRRTWRFALTDTSTRRDYGWLAIHGTFGVIAGVLPLEILSQSVQAVSVPLQWQLTAHDESTIFGLIIVETGSQAWSVLFLAFAFAALWLLLSPILLRLQMEPGRRLLSPDPSIDLSARVAQLTATRAAALDAHAVELRRIERALHDGSQNRLVAVTVLTGAARQALEREHDGVDAMLERIQSSAELALAELRSVVRSILPPALERHGLPDALVTLAAECPVPTQISVPDELHCPLAVEAIVYYAAAEALTNVSQHSGAGAADITVAHDGKILMIRVIDDGVGGATAREGSGLSGITRRAEAHDGSMTVTSPPGGPTKVEVILPCG